MSLPRRLPTNRKAEVDRSSRENDRTPTYTSNVTTAPTHRMTARNVSVPVLSGRDSVMVPDETRSSLTDILGVAETSEVATPRYSKRPSGNFKFSPSLLICMNFVSILSDLC